MSPQAPTTATIPPVPQFQPLSIDIASFAPIIVLIAFGIWLVFSFAVTYHWFRYAHRSWLTVPALTAHVFVSGALILYAISGLA